MRTARRALVALAGSIVLLVTFAGAASAHAVLESTDPVAASTLTTPPTHIELTFGESVTVSDGSIRLFDAAGREVQIGAPTHPGGNGPEVASKVPKLSSGTYVVAWRVISADSHPVNGAFTFNVGASSADASGLVTKFEDAGGSKTVGVLFGGVKWLGYATASLVVGGFLFVSCCWDGGPASERARRWLVRSAVVGAVVAVLAIAFEGPYGGGFGIGQLFKPSLWWETLGERFGRAELARAVCFGGAFVLARSVDRARSAGWRAQASIVSLALAASIAFAGHGATGRWVLAAFGLDVVHVLAFSVWIGGLVGLVAWALRDGEVRSVVDASRRFSAVAMAAVALVVASGVVQGIRQVGWSWVSLTSTTYGRLLLSKVAVVVVVLGVAWVSRTLVHAFVNPEPADLEVADVEVAEPDRVPVLAGVGGGGGDAEGSEGVEDVDDDDDDDGDEFDLGERNDLVRRYLRRSVGVEVLGIVAVLVLGTLLSSVIPAGEAVALPFSQTIVDSDGFAQIEVLPAKAGIDAIHVTITNSDGTIPNLAQMTVELRLPARRLGPLDVSMEQLAPNHYVQDSATIPFPGTWTVTVLARVGDFDEKTFVARVPVH